MWWDIKYAVSRWLFRHGFDLGTKTYVEWQQKTMEASNRWIDAQNYYVI